MKAYSDLLDVGRKCGVPCENRVHYSVVIDLESQPC